MLNYQDEFYEIRSVLNQLGFQVDKIQYLASGDDSDVLLCGGQFVAKIPKRREVHAAQQREFSLYRFLSRQHLSFQTPRTVYQGEQFNIMTFLPGEPVSFQMYKTLTEREKEALASDEAQFLQELHQIKIDISCGIFQDVVEDKSQRFNQEYTYLCTALKDKGLLSSFLHTKISKIYDNLLSSRELFQYNPCLVHNDFSSDNMVFQNKRLYGVIDFGDFAVGDPDNDFLCILDCSEDDFGKEFGRKVLRHYGHPHPSIAERKAELNDAYWPLQQILLGNRRNDTALLNRGYRRLEKIDPNIFIF